MKFVFRLYYKANISILITYSRGPFYFNLDSVRSFILYTILVKVRKKPFTENVLIVELKVSLMWYQVLQVRKNSNAIPVFINLASMNFEFTL